MLTIGAHKLTGKVLLAPMAGVTDRPFRQLCRRFGAALACSEMLSSDTSLWHSRKSQWRMNHQGETGPRAVQIAGGDAAMMAEAARLNAEQGADIIDINMGCPAKKVCRKAAGSALLRDEALVESILHAVVAAVDIPVTLKIRTGWSPEQRNGVRIAQLAEQAGIQMLSVHGRTRACGYRDTVEYDTIAAIKQAVNIPVIANGDIRNPQQAAAVLASTGCDGVMIGRAAQGSPWIFNQVDQFLRNGVIVAPPSPAEQQSILQEHLDALYTFYGDYTGCRIARKHVGWYLKEHNNGDNFRQLFNRLETAREQQTALQQFFELRSNREEIAA